MARSDSPVLGATIATVDPASLTCMVTIPAWDGGQDRHGPARYVVQGAATHPERGQPCTVVVDEAGRLAIAAWTPPASAVDAASSRLALGVRPTYIGELVMSGSPRPPAPNLLRPNGVDVSRSAWPDLFEAYNPIVGPATITLGSPGVLTAPSHGLSVGDRIYLTTTGTLPGGLIASARYWVASVTTSTLTVAVTAGGGPIPFTGSQSGAHTLRMSPYGTGDGVTTFGLPDLRDRALIAPGTLHRAGHAFGSETTALSVSQLPTHNAYQSGSTSGFANGSASAGPVGAPVGGGQAIPLTQPSLAVSMYIVAAL